MNVSAIGLESRPLKSPNKPGELSGPDFVNFFIHSLQNWILCWLSSGSLDIALSVAVLLLLWPLMLLMAVFIYLEDHGPVFYNQLRTGRGFREFDLHKFRSMRLNNIPVEQIPVRYRARSPFRNADWTADPTSSRLMNYRSCLTSSGAR